ncbi:hypothetical protein [Luteimonas kalidii]|uniref:DUF3325 domain-containing protein n=1 Tax=Luteimonas kalidii TaxID=3042025 RepID=A0ABT6JU26_9GAMM|nr:hypothetical protein [Luteimonas kalidii]MDH5833970.1 hypothetical protein [Luteimonas kalidii]
MVVFATLLLLAGWWSLALAMVPGTLQARRRALRVGAGAGFAISLAGYVAAIGIEQGPVFWTAALMLSALAVALLRALAFERDRRGQR